MLHTQLQQLPRDTFKFYLKRRDKFLRDATTQASPSMLKHLSSIKALVEEEADKMLFGLSERKVSDSANPPTKKPKKGLMSLLEDVINSPNEDVLLTPEGRKAEVKKEIHNYLCLDVAVGNPLNWWQQNEKLLPALSHMAKKYLCVPATSVPAERAFSVAGYIVNEKRSCLLPENINMLVFLAGNLEIP